MPLAVFLACLHFECASAQQHESNACIVPFRSIGLAGIKDDFIVKAGRLHKTSDSLVHPLSVVAWSKEGNPFVRREDQHSPAFAVCTQQNRAVLVEMQLSRERQLRSVCNPPVFTKKLNSAKG